MFQEKDDANILATSLVSVCNDIHDALESVLGNDEEKVSTIASRLINYRHVEDINEIHLGKFTKLLHKTQSVKKLLNAGVVTGIKFCDTGCNILFLNTFSNRVMQYRFDEYLFFQRLSDQEKLILYSLDMTR